MSSPRVEDDERSLRKTRSLHSLASTAIPPPVHFKSLKVSEEQLRSIKNKSVRKFYEVEIQSLAWITVIEQCLIASK